MNASTDPAAGPRSTTGAAAGPAVESRSTTTLLGDLVHQVSELFRKEIQLFRAEIGEKTNQAVTAAGLIVGGIVLAITAINVLAAALIAGLAELGIDSGWAALIVGVALAVIGYGLVNSGIQSLKASSLAPDRTQRQIQKDVQVAKESVR